MSNNFNVHLYDDNSTKKMIPNDKEQSKNNNEGAGSFDLDWYFSWLC